MPENREGSATDKLLNLYESAFASSLLRDWARADAAFAKALAITRASPNSSPRAERAVALTQAQSLLDRGAPGRAMEAMHAYASDGSRPVLLLSAQIALAEVPTVTPDSAELRARASELQTWVALHPDDSARLGIARPGLGPPRPAAAFRSAPRPNRATCSAT